MRNDGRRPAPPDQRRLWTAMGLLAGGASSAVAWTRGWTILGMNSGGAGLLAILGGKVIVAIVLMLASQRLRYVGVGLLLSIPLGALILVSTCFTHLSAPH